MHQLTDAEKRAVLEPLDVGTREAWGWSRPLRVVSRTPERIVLDGGDIWRPYYQGRIEIDRSAGTLRYVAWDAASPGEEAVVVPLPDALRDYWEERPTNR